MLSATGRIKKDEGGRMKDESSSARFPQPGKAHALDRQGQGGGVRLNNRSSFILPPSSFALHAASQETSLPRQFQLALRRAGEAKDDQTKYSQEHPRHECRTRNQLQALPGQGNRCQRLIPSSFSPQLWTSLHFDQRRGSG